MDFPLRLKDNKWATAMEEFRQDVTLLLKNPIRTFFQSLSLGNQAPIHGSDEDTLEIGIRQTIKQLPGTEIEYLKIAGDVVELHLKYKDDIVKFHFSVDSDYEK